jgi:hypothetical protein
LIFLARDTIRRKHCAKTGLVEMVCAEFLSDTGVVLRMLPA